MEGEEDLAGGGAPPTPLRLIVKLPKMPQEQQQKEEEKEPKKRTSADAPSGLNEEETQATATGAPGDAENEKKNLSTQALPAVATEVEAAQKDAQAVSGGERDLQRKDAAEDE